MSRLFKCLMIFGTALLLSGCWRENMASQPKAKPYQESSFFADGTTARPLPLGVIPRGDLRLDSLLYRGFVDGKPAEHFPSHYPTEDDGPFPLRGPELRRILEHGQELFAINCEMCHGASGDGYGIVVHRGMVPPPSFHLDRIRLAPVGHIFDVITNGYGAMYSYADHISPPDRWEIVAYVRTLQMSQAIPAAQAREAAVQ
jgi:mono/diheme cytochrome c family protein